MGLIDELLGRGRRARRKRVRAAVGCARDAPRRGEPQRALEIARAALLDGPGEPRLLRLLADALRARRSRDAGDAATADFFARAADSPDDPQRLFELGSHMLWEEQPRLAGAFLGRALSFAPFDAVIRSELALAQARSGRPAEVVQTLALHPCLADDPGALLQFGWASLLCADVEAARGACDELAGCGRAVALTRKLRCAIDRASVPPASTPPDARDYLYLEHATVLLTTDLASTGAHSGGPAAALGRHGRVVLRPELLARVLGSATSVLRQLAPSTRRVCPLDAGMRPTAAALARALGAELAPLGPGRVPACVLVARRAADLAQLGSRLEAPPGEVTTLALTLDWSCSASRVPELVGLLARDLMVEEAVLGAPPPPAGTDPALTSFVEQRRAWLPPGGCRVTSAYVPDAPLPWA